MSAIAITTAPFAKWTKESLIKVFTVVHRKPAPAEWSEGALREHLLAVCTKPKEVKAAPVAAPAPFANWTKEKLVAAYTTAYKQQPPANWTDVELRQHFQSTRKRNEEAKADPRRALRHVGEAVVIRTGVWGVTETTILGMDDAKLPQKLALANGQVAVWYSRTGEFRLNDLQAPKSTRSYLTFGTKLTAEEVAQKKAAYNFHCKHF